MLAGLGAFGRFRFHFRGAFPYVASLNVYALYPQVWEGVGVRFVRVFYEGRVLSGLD